MDGNVSTTSLPKYLHVRVETEREWAMNDYDTAVIYFIDPASPEFRGWDEALSEWVWLSTNVKEIALAEAQIKELD